MYEELMIYLQLLFAVIYRQTLRVLKDIMCIFFLSINESCKANYVPLQIELASKG